MIQKNHKLFDFERALDGKPVNPFSSNINMDTLLTVLHVFLMLPVGRFWGHAKKQNTAVLKLNEKKRVDQGERANVDQWPFSR